jgi:hypothetical protein
MAAVTYHGEFGEGQDTITQHGYEFGRDGKSVNVTDKALLEKFANNRFFKTADSDKDQVEAAQTEAQANEAETLRAYLAEHNVPVRANANLASLQKARADYDAAVLKAQE